MKATLNLRNSAAFAALLFVMHELHEIVHIVVGYILCGCWGERDFNVWSLCEGCSETEPLAFLSTLAGPVFTFAMIYIGYYLLSNRYRQQPGMRAFGFALIFANMPFARILTVGLGGGDEMQVLDSLWGSQASGLTLWIIGFAAVVLVALPPLIRAWNVLRPKKRIWVFSGFFILPLAVDIVAVLIIMNRLLEQGILDQTGIIGSPLLVNLWTLLWVILLAIFWKDLKTILRPAD